MICALSASRALSADAVQSMAQVGAPPVPPNFRIDSSTATGITMAWDDVIDETGYKIYKWDGLNFVYLASVGADTTSYTESRSPDCGWNEYYQVSAYNDSGESAKAAFIHGYTKPCTPMLITPANNTSYPHNYDVSFEWEPSAGANEYRVEWWRGSNNPTIACDWITETACHLGTLEPGYTYSWRVRARNTTGEPDGSGNSLWSETWQFTIKALPDLIVESVTALPASPIVNQPVTFTVRVKNQGAGDVETDFYVDLFLDSQPVGDCSESSNIWWNVLSLPSGATEELTFTYDGFNTSGTHNLYPSADTSCYIEETDDTNNILGPVPITVRPQRPAAFNKTGPANGAKGQPISVTLTWTASARANTYQYCYDTTNDGACSNWIGNGTSTSKRLTGLSYSTWYYWHVRAVNGGGTRYSGSLDSPTDFWSFKTQGPPVQTAFNATVEDGWVLESSEASNVGGSMNAAQTTFNVGDAAGDKQFRSLLSFNTASLPDNAVITAVTFKVMQQSVAGTNPFTTHGNLMLDVRKGPFAGNAALQLADFQATANKSGMVIPNTPAAGWYVRNLPANTLTLINKVGVTQFRLRFALDDNDDLAADLIRFFSGNAPVANRPKLIIRYYIP
jgi:hypothetical protein